VQLDLIQVASRRAKEEGEGYGQSNIHMLSIIPEDGQHTTYPW
jgi:hypothetical protein